MKKDILVISNGFGEDTIAAFVAKELSQYFNILAMPLVGNGKMYENFKFNLIKAKDNQNLASKGISGFANPINFLKDLFSGYISLTVKQIKLIKKLSNDIEFVLAVGDIYPFILSYMFSNKDIYYIATAKSNYVVKHNFFEVLFFKKAKLAFFRDKLTADQLKKQGLKNAIYAGNAMLDCVKSTGKVWKDELIIGIFPGSRDEAFKNFSIQIKVIEELKNNLNLSITVLVGIFPELNINKFIENMNKNLWKINYIEDKNIKLKATYDNIKVYLLQDAIGDILSYSKIILGQAGTANEQAAGYSIPVIAFEDLSKKLNWYRWRQKKLLSDAIIIVDKDIKNITNTIINILNDKQLYKKMADTGKQRMGNKGAVKKIAQIIYKDYINSNSNSN